MNLDLARAAAEAVDLKRVATLTQELVRIRSVIEPGAGGSEQGVAATLRTSCESWGSSRP